MNSFFGIEVSGEGRVVQDWFNGLPIAARDEIVNFVLHLERLPMGLWDRPDFDPLEGEGGISEFRPKDVRLRDGNHVYRIYGLKAYPVKRSYTFLHGTDKRGKGANDAKGKGRAKWRATQLANGAAHPHRFDFEGKPAPTLKTKQ